MNNIFYEVKKLEKLKRSLQKQQLDLKSQTAIVEDLLASIELAERIKLLPNEGETISYRLGKILIDAKSFKGLCLLPKRLYLLSIYAKERKRGSSLQNKKNIVINRAEDENTIGKGRINKAEEGASLVTNKNNVKTNTILTLVDDFSFENYQKLFPAYFLMGQNKNQITSTKAFVFLVETTWKGHSGYWKYGLISPGFKHPKALELLDAIRRLKDREVPMLFLYRESLQHYRKFLSVARESNIVITCNELMLDNFKKDIPEKQIFFIDNFTNEFLCNMSNSCNFVDKKGIAYIGEYESLYNNDDDSQIEEYLTKAKIKDFVLIKKKSSNKKSYSRLNKANTLIIDDDASQLDLISIINAYKFVFNIADPVDRVIPRKVIDALALGVPVISTRSDYLEEKFSDVIQFVDNAEQIQSVVDRYADRWEYSKLAHLGHRNVTNSFLSHFAKKKILNVINRNKLEIVQNTPMVSIIMASMREKYIDRIITNISRQTYPNKEFIIVTQNFSKEGIDTLTKKLGEMSGFVSFKVIENNTKDTLGDRQNLAIKHAVGEYVAKFDDDDFYFNNYLTDMIKPFSFGDYDMVGKAEFFIYLEGLNQTVLIRDGKASYREMDFVSGATFVIKKKVFDKLQGFSSVNQSEDSDLLKRLKASGGKIYSADPYNFVVFRSENVTEHTWQQKAEAFAKSCTFVCTGIDENIVSI